MKKAVWLLIMVVIIVVLTAACNKSVCPAYVMDSNPQQTENNG